MQVHASSPPSPPTEPVATPPSTVDTTALSEDPVPGKREREVLDWDIQPMCEGREHAAHFWLSVVIMWDFCRGYTPEMFYNWYFVLTQDKCKNVGQVYRNLVHEIQIVVVHPVLKCYSHLYSKLYIQHFIQMSFHVLFWMQFCITSSAVIMSALMRISLFLKSESQ